jgi:hypothetical protein
MQAEDRRKQSNSPRDTATARHVRPRDKGELLTITNIIINTGSEATPI